MTPLSIRHKMTQELHNVPCGKCPSCMSRRASGWSFRLMQEYKAAKHAVFLTLTYDTKHIPITRASYMSLKKRDLQLFFKRLRKAHEKEQWEDKIKYYAVGEYGGKTKRPHYHIILFNAKLELIQPAWNLGHIHYGQVNEASVGYTLKYISKPSKVPQHKNDDRIREFSLMSKGLGENYLTPEMVKWHKSAMTDRMYVNLLDGKKVSMPRYYKEKIYNEHERKAIGAKARLGMIERQQKEMDKAGPLYYALQAEAHLAAFRLLKKKADEGLTF